MNNLVKKQFAFTLSEVLVTLAIIGVVSALTVPTLVTGYQRKAYIAQLRKATLEVGQAADLLLTDEGKTTLAATSLKTNVSTFLKNYLRITQDCGTTMTPCFAASYATTSGSAATVKCENGYSVTTNAGYSICAIPGNPVTIVADVNGPDDPNIAGRDLFTFSIYEDASVDEGMSPSDKQSKGSDDLKTLRSTNAAKCGAADTSNGEGCFSKIVQDNWQMTY